MIVSANLWELHEFIITKASSALATQYRARERVKSKFSNPFLRNTIVINISDEIINIVVGGLT